MDDIVTIKPGRPGQPQRRVSSDDLIEIGALIISVVGLLAKLADTHSNHVTAKANTRPLIDIRGGKGKLGKVKLRGHHWRIG